MIRTNKLKITINEDELFDKYDIFKIHTKDTFIPFGSQLLDQLKENTQVLSVFFKKGANCFLLMQKNPLNNKILQNRKNELLLQKNTKLDKKALENATIKKITDIEEIDKRTIASLLLNALPTYINDDLKMNNLTGHLYCYEIDWLIKKKNGIQEDKLSFPTIELAIDENERMEIKIITFTSLALKQYMTFSEERPLNVFPQYIINGKYFTISRKPYNFKNNNQHYYIIKKTDDDKRNIKPFLDIGSFDKYNRTKIGIIHKMLKIYNKKYTKISSLEFEHIPEYEEINTETLYEITKEEEENLQQIIFKKDKNIRIINQTNDEKGDELAKQIKKQLKKEYNVDATIGKTLQDEKYNILIIHSKEYYKNNKELNDIYTNQYNNKIFQHVTIEDFKINIPTQNTKRSDPEKQKTFTKSPALKKILIEMIIKEDIQNHKLHLFDWQKTNIKEEVTFIKAVEINSEVQYFFVKIHPTGTLTLNKKTRNLFNYEEIEKYDTIYITEKDKIDYNIDCIIEFKSGDINIIRKTGWFTVPELDLIENELKTTQHMRTNENIALFYQAIAGIKVFKQDDKILMLSGIQSKGMNRTLAKAINIREIVPINDSNIHFNDIMNLMCTSYIRSSQIFTSIPYPIKYLREYINLNISTQ